jgi:hypothetical protein
MSPLAFQNQVDCSKMKPPPPFFDCHLHIHCTPSDSKHRLRALALFQILVLFWMLELLFTTSAMLFTILVLLLTTTLLHKTPALFLQNSVVLSNIVVAPQNFVAISPNSTAPFLNFGTLLNPYTTIVTSDPRLLPQISRRYLFSPAPWDSCDLAL